MAEPVLITIRVHPGASRTHVGGLHCEPGQRPERARASGRRSGPVNAAGPVQAAGQIEVLGVWVQQRAVDGKATQAALAALADALGVRRRSLRIVTGERARLKVVEVSDPPAELAERLASPRRAG